MRSLFTSTPPTRVAPSVHPEGSSSRTPSLRNPVSTQSSAVAKRSAMPASRVTISRPSATTRPTIVTIAHLQSVQNVSRTRRCAPSPLVRNPLQRHKSRSIYALGDGPCHPARLKSLPPQLHWGESMLSPTLRAIDGAGLLILLLADTDPCCLPSIIRGSRGGAQPGGRSAASKNASSRCIARR